MFSPEFDSRYLHKSIKKGYICSKFVASQTVYFPKVEVIQNFSKNGKTWIKLQHISSHFTNLDTRYKQPYKDCEIVEYAVTEKSVTSTEEFLEAKKKRLEEREKREEAEREKREIEYNEKQIKWYEEQLKALKVKREVLTM